MEFHFLKDLVRFKEIISKLLKRWWDGWLAVTLSLSTAWVEEMWLPVSWQQLSDSTDCFLQDAVTASMWLLPHSKFLYAGHLPGYQINGVDAIGRRGRNSKEGGWRTKEGKRWTWKLVRLVTNASPIRLWEPQGQDALHFKLQTLLQNICSVCAWI